MALPGFPIPGCVDTNTTLGIAVQIEAEKLLASANAPKLHIVAHSLGGVAARVWLKYYGGSNEVVQYLSLGSPHHGVERSLPFTNCPPIPDLGTRTSPFLVALNAPYDTLPDSGIRYTSIATIYDKLVTPAPQAGLLTGPDANQVVIQDVCSNSMTGHITLPYDGPTYSIVRSVLRGEGSKADCTTPGIALPDPDLSSWPPQLQIPGSLKRSRWPIRDDRL